MTRPALIMLDANTVEDVTCLRAGVNAAMVDVLHEAIKDGRAIVPLSEAVAMELMAIAPKDATRAYMLGQSYLQLASLHLATKATGRIVRESIEARLGGPPFQALQALTPRERQNVEVRLTGKAPGEVATIVARNRADIQEWLSHVRQYAAAARRLAGKPKSMPVADLVQKVWNGMAPQWARGMADRQGLMSRVETAGLADRLLEVPAIGASVGFMVGLACTQAFNGRKPEHGDYHDAQHCMLAAAAGALLVTNDGRLRDLAKAIPTRPLRAMPLAEALNTLRREAV